MPRTDQATVSKVIEVDDDIWDDVFVTTASVLVDRLVSVNDDATITDDIFTNIETYLAAHFYALRDPQYQFKSTGKAQATFQGQTGKGLDLTWWGQTAKVLDPTGLLESIFDNEGEVGIYWLGGGQV